MAKYQFFNRDLSWLSFNRRVLEEAANNSLPLYERIKFMAIFSSNLDEFYRVRVATYKRFTQLPVEDKKQLRENPDTILRKIKAEVSKQQIEFGRIFSEQIIPELEGNNIILLQNDELEKEHSRFVKNFFMDNLQPYVQPMLLLKKKVLPFLQNNVIYFAVKLYKRNKNNNQNPQKRRARYALVNVPCGKFGRFIQLPQIDDKHYVIFLDDIVRSRIKLFFPGYKVDSCFSFKISRDSDLQIEDEYSGDLVEMIEKNLSKRETGAPARFLYDSNIPDSFLRFLKEAFLLDSHALIKGGKYHNFHDFFNFPNPLSPQLELKPHIPMQLNGLRNSGKSIFKAIKKENILLHFPYQTYQYVIRFFNEAALDPNVEEIKVTQYRVADNSAVVNALIAAARNGKKVTVFVEVKARFNEVSNLRSAREMLQAGVKIIYSIPGLKVHTKTALVIRKDGKKDFAYLSTGNFNENTAKVYVDYGYFTTNEQIIEELKALFNYLEHKVSDFEFKQLLVGQFNLNSELKRLIQQEIDNVDKGGKGYMLLKMNGLQDREMIERLYRASQKGVKIDIILRGVCCLKPNQKYSKNIRVVRIVDQFLEHARAFYFYNNGDDLLYLSSADWMNRNLHRRVECAFPILDEEAKKELLDVLNIQLADNVSARLLDENLNNIPIEAVKNAKRVRSQMEILKYLKQKNRKRRKTEV